MSWSNDEADAQVRAGGRDNSADFVEVMQHGELVFRPTLKLTLGGG